MLSLPENVLITIIVVGALVVVIVPVSLKIAGLTGQQIVDVLKITLDVFLAAVKEFRSQNSKPSSP